MINIFVAKLSPGTRGEDLRGLFEPFGQVHAAKVIVDRDTNQSKRYGFVEMPDETEAQAAIDALNDTDFQGSRIIVKVSIPKDPDQPSGPRRNYPRSNR